MAVSTGTSTPRCKRTLSRVYLRIKMGGTRRWLHNQQNATVMLIWQPLSLKGACGITWKWDETVDEWSEPLIVLRGS